MVTEVALVLVHVSESGAPLSMVVLAAVSVTVGGPLFEVTEIVTLAVLVWPPDAVAVIT